MESPRGFRTGCYMGVDGDRPTRIIDAYVHEVDPGVVSTIHRHSWDAVMRDRRGSRLDRSQRLEVRVQAVGYGLHPGVVVAPSGQ